MCVEFENNLLVLVAMMAGDIKRRGCALAEYVEIFQGKIPGALSSRRLERPG